MTTPQTVADIGELGLLDRLFQFCPTDVVGDDAAVIDVPPGQKLVVTTDVLVDGVHFSDRTTSPEDIGWRAIAANLSDLAAMGAKPEGVTVGLSLPGTTHLDWIEGIYRGMADCLQQWGGAVIGGDLCRSDTVSLAITALGRVKPERVLYRNTAQPGQLIVVTGYHGLSRAGLELLLHPEAGAELPVQVRARWCKAHQRPRPRLDIIDALNSLWSSKANPTTIAAMDSSDGLANAVQLICKASEVGAQLWRTHLPLDPALVDWVGPNQAIDWCLYGGEDFELVLCLPKAQAEQLKQILESPIYIIGQITGDPSIELWPDQEDSSGQIELSLKQGFQHF
jgi:thiamine-monophosphate kinase